MTPWIPQGNRIVRIDQFGGATPVAVFTGQDAELYADLVARTVNADQLHAERSVFRHDYRDGLDGAAERLADLTQRRLRLGDPEVEDALINVRCEIVKARREPRIDCSGTSLIWAPIMLLLWAAIIGWYLALTK